MKEEGNNIFELALEHSKRGAIFLESGKIIYMNPQAKEILEEDLYMKDIPNIKDYLQKEDYDRAGELVNVLETGFSDWVEGEYIVNLKNGKKKNIKTSAKLINKDTNTILIEISDISEDIRIDKEKESYKFSLEQVMDEAPIAILILDEKGVIQFFNKYTFKGRIIKKEDVIGKSVGDFVKHRNTDPVYDKLAYAIDNKVNIKEVIPFKKNNGNKFWFELNVKYIKNESRDDSSFIALVQDVTELRAMEEQVKNFNKKLKTKVAENTLELKTKAEKIERSQQAMIFLLEDMKETQKMLKESNESLEQLNTDLESFNYSASHDLKAPLRVINNYSKFILEDMGESMTGESREMLQEIIAQGERMSQLLGDLFYFSRFGGAKLKKTIINMKELVSAIFSEELRLNDQSDKFKITIDRLPSVFADYSLIKQVIINLISNAVKFTQHKEKPEIYVGFSQDNDYITYYFKDNGVGFSNDKSQYIFELFKRLKTEYHSEGTGVGLSIVKRIIEKHRGKVYAKGVLGEGAEIGFVLPKKNIK